MNRTAVGRKGTFGRRRRQESIPYASISFLIMIFIFSVWFSGRDSRGDLLSTESSLIDLITARTSNSYGDLCHPDKGIFGSKYALFFLIPAVIVMFVGLAIVTDDYFVTALDRISDRLNLSEDVAGATFMAAGSSTPEFFASMLGVFITNDDVGIGTIVGSAVFNVLVIIGLSAALAGSVLSLDWRPLARDSFFYMLSIVLVLIFVLGPSQGEIKWYEGLILVSSYVFYVLFMAFFNEPYMKWAENLHIGKSSREYGMEKWDSSIDKLEEGSGKSHCTDAYTEETLSNYRTTRSEFRVAQLAVVAANRFASPKSDILESCQDDEKKSSGTCIEIDSPPNRVSVQSLTEIVDVEKDEIHFTKTLFGIDLPGSAIGWIFFPITFFWKVMFSFTILDCSSEKRAKYWWATFILSILWISGISYVMVEAARVSGCLIGIPAAAMGLTVLAAGTSVPDALASISVARDGAADMAVSNAIGSNVFDILLGLGLPWFLGGIAKKNILVPTDPLTRVVIPILILFAIMVLLLVLLFILRWKLRPLLGYILFCIYGLFVLYTLLDVFVFKLSGDNA